jgi:hypothetical protein
MADNANTKTSPPRTKFLGWWVQSPKDLFNAIELFLRDYGGPLGSPVVATVIYEANKCVRHLSLICPYLPEPPWPDPSECWKNGWAPLTLVQQWCKKAHPVWEKYFAQKEEVCNGARQVGPDEGQIVKPDLAAEMRGRAGEEKPNGRGPSGEMAGEGNLAYAEIDLAGRTLTVGEKKKITPSDKIWEFLKELTDAKRHSLPDLKPAEWRSAMTMLRKKISRENMRSIIERTVCGYKLAPDVKLKGGGQMGIHKTK